MFKKLSTETTKGLGDDAERRALDHLRRHGLRLVARNYRVARGARARGGEVDLIMRAPDGTVLFIEVRARGDLATWRTATRRRGGAAASVSRAKQARVIFSATGFLRTQALLPPCRFDVATIDGDRIEWLRGAFDVPQERWGSRPHRRQARPAWLLAGRRESPHSPLARLRQRAGERVSPAFIIARSCWNNAYNNNSSKAPTCSIRSPRTCRARSPWRRR